MTVPHRTHDFSVGVLFCYKSQESVEGKITPVYLSFIICIVHLFYHLTFHYTRHLYPLLVPLFRELHGAGGVSIRTNYINLVGYLGLVTTSKTDPRVCTTHQLH